MTASCIQKDQEALKIARNVLRKDPEFLDVRCAITAYLWALGDTAAAEGEWSQLQQAQGVRPCSHIIITAQDELPRLQVYPLMCACEFHPICTGCCADSHLQHLQAKLRMHKDHLACIYFVG
jgi:hypothetical protein